MLQAIRETVEALMTPVREQLDHERARADRAEEKAAALRAELVDLRMAEQAAANLAEYGTAQAVDLRKRLEAAGQRASDERNRADRERDRADKTERQLTAVEADLVKARVEAAGLRCRLEQARPKLVTEPPRSPWRRFLAWRR
jgi:chromosome segregation ATPase